MGDFVGTSKYLKMTQYMVISCSSLPCEHGGLLLEKREKIGLCHPLKLDESCPKFDHNQIQDEVNDLRLEKVKDVNRFDLEVIEVHNANNVDLVKTHVANVLADAKLPNVCDVESFIIVPSNSHGYTTRNSVICNHPICN
jgi:hypothetical protein